MIDRYKNILIIDEYLEGLTRPINTSDLWKS